jgi:hypothetical protein
MTTEVSRRSILARGAAGAAVAALPASVGAAVQDPIFSAIELHREALRVYDETHQTWKHRMDGRWERRKLKGAAAHQS